MVTRNPRPGGTSTPDVTARPGGQQSGPGAAARGGARDARDKAEEVTERVADRAQSAFEKTRSMMVERVEAVQAALQKATDHLRQDDQSALARGAEQISRQAERVTRYLRERSPAELKSDLDRTARERPAVFLGAAFLLGLFSARFLKSSERGDGATRSSSRLRGGASSGYGLNAPGAEGVSYGTT